MNIDLDLKYNDYVKGVKELNPEQQLNLIEIISVQLKKNIANKKVKHSIMELEGLGAKLWKGIDTSAKKGGHGLKG